jgi:hypothetical protein
VYFESRGFICREFVYQTYGGILLYRLLFAESGNASATQTVGDGQIDKDIFNV